MAVYDFGSLTSADSVPDMRSDAEKENSQLSIYNQQKADLAYAEKQAEELINISGAPVTVFRKLLKGDSEEQEVWDEDADPLFASGVTLKAYMKLETANYEYTRWGIDNPLKLKIIFSRASVLKLFAPKLIVLGDIIRVPYGAAFAALAPQPRPFYFRVMNAYDSSNFMYRWLYYTAVSELITGDITLKVNHE